MVFPVIMIVVGIVFLIGSAYLIKSVLQQTNHYRWQWLVYLVFIGAFILSYSASIFMVSWLIPIVLIIFMAVCFY